MALAWIWSTDSNANVPKDLTAFSARLTFKNVPPVPARTALSALMAKIVTLASVYPASLATTVTQVSAST